MSVSNQETPMFRITVRTVFSFLPEMRILHSFAPQIGQLNKRHGEKYKSLCGKWFCVGPTFGNDNEIDVGKEGFIKCKKCDGLHQKNFKGRV